MGKNNKLIILFAIVFLLSIIHPVSALDQWWNDTWHYRVKIQINTTIYERTDWLVEREMNFTEILKNFSVNGTFNVNSTRLFEYNSSGSILDLVPSQFDVGENYNSIENAVGTLIFMLNGTNPANTTRYYYLYFDIVENGIKESISYNTDLKWSWDGEEFNVNNSIGRWWVDTNRGENTSGIYNIWLEGGWLFETSPQANEKTFEYIQYNNGTHNLTFDLRNNASFVNGSVRIKVTQIGDEIIWGQPNSKTNQGRIIKEYYFYSKKPWIKITQKIINTAVIDINRSSWTAAALAFDVGRVWNDTGLGAFDGNTTDPGSWYSSKYEGGSSMGVINLNETASEFFADYLPWDPTTKEGKVGIQLNNTTISAYSSITEIAVAYFNRTHPFGAYQNIPQLINRFFNPADENQTEEQLVVITQTLTDYPIYNRGEDAYIFANITKDTYNFTYYVNATIIDPTGTNQTIILYDDGSHGDGLANDDVYTNYLNFTSSDPVGTWTILTRMYDINNYYLNQSTDYFNLTDIYNVTVNVINPQGFGNRTVFADILVKDFIGRLNISNAIINCSYQGTKLFNITDFYNGSYLLNFSAPDVLGNYLLECNATKDGNFGNNTDQFLVEPKKSYMSSVVEPNNYTSTTIIWNTSESFEIFVNISNIGQGYVYSANISLELPENSPLNWTANSTLYPLKECGGIYINESCTGSFNITVPEKTLSGIYYVNASATWTNPDGTLNSTFTSVIVNVTSNILMEIPEDFIEGIVGGGKSKIVGNFTIHSQGNDPLYNVTFNTTGLTDFNITFIPVNFSSIGGSTNETVLINVSVPYGYLPGFYNGTINVSTANDGYKNITLSIVISGTNMSLLVEPETYTSTTIIWNTSESFEIFVNISNTGNGTAYSANISLELPENSPLNWTANSTLYPLKECGDVEPLIGYCESWFNITVAERTASGNYLINISAIWYDSETGNHNITTILNVTVTSNPVLYIIEDIISNYAEHNKETHLGNFTIQSIGNDPLINISYNISGLPGNFTFELIENVTSLSAGINATVMFNVTIPIGYNPGTYTGTLNVTTVNDGYKNLTLQIIVPINRTWNISSSYCEHSMTPLIDTLCELYVNNIGNVELNITISPPNANLTWVNETNFIIPKQEYHVFSVWYNVTGIPLHFNYSYYNISANVSAIPNYIILQTLLTPYIGPSMQILLSTNKVEQTSGLEIYANVTDRSYSGIQFVQARVTIPNNTFYTTNMTKINTTGNVSFWNASFPSNWGNTVQKGFYTILVESIDNKSAYGNATSNFTVYTKLDVILNTGFNIYYQGETGSINYWARDIAALPIVGASVNLSIKNPNNQNIYILSGNTYQTNSLGTIDIGPFILPSDAVSGNYILTANTSYYDSLVNFYVFNTSVFNFTVQKRSGLSAKVSIPVVQYVDHELSIFVQTYRYYILEEPDTIDLTLYYATEQFGLVPWFTITKINMTKISDGWYHYTRNIDSSTLTGNYLATLNVSKDNVLTGDVSSFQILKGGPFDVSIRTIQSEVPAGSPLNFEINITNKGSTDNFDVNVTYWIDDGTTYSRRTMVQVPARDSILITDSFDINSGESLGVHNLSVKVAYDVTFAPAEASTTFSVIAPTTTTTAPSAPPGPAPGAPPGPAPPPVGPTPTGVGKLEITKYPDDISVERGWIKYPIIEVKNSGQIPLNDVILTITGIPTSWYTIEPNTIPLLSVGLNRTFTITLNVPISAEAKDYYCIINATSKGASDSKMIVIHVFSSREELLDFEIKKLKQEVKDFQNLVEDAKKAGKDVSDVLTLLDEINKQIEMAEYYLLNKMYDESLASVYAARSLLNRAKYALTIAPMMKRVLIPIIPMWIIVLVVVLVMFVIVLLVVMKKMRVDLFRVLRPNIPQAAEATGEVKQKPFEREVLEAEKDRINRMLKLLETELNEGVISKKAYEELRFRNMSKLEDVEAKLRQIK